MSPWLNTADAAEYLRYTGKRPRRSVYKFIKRHGIVVRHDGDRVLLARADVDRALENQRRSHVRDLPTRNTSSVMTVLGKRSCSAVPNTSSFQGVR